MPDLPVADTMEALDRALSRIAVGVAGSPRAATELLLAIGRGDSSARAQAFLAEGAALLRARLLLAQAA